MTHDFLNNLKITQKTNIYGNIVGDSDALAIAELAKKTDALILVITNDSKEAFLLQKKLTLFCQQNTIISILPAWDTLPYDHFSPNKNIISDRLTVLYQIKQLKTGILIVPIQALMQKLCPVNFLISNSLVLKVGDKIIIDELKSNIQAAGYNNVSQVMQHGEFASRGSLLDLFPMGSNKPYRIDFFDNEVDSINIFDIDSQRSVSQVSAINLLPAHEFPTDKKNINQFRERFANLFKIRSEPEHIYQQISQGFLPAGIEYWQPLFFDAMETLFNYLSTEIIICIYNDLEQSAVKFYDDIKARYQSYAVDQMRPLLEPKNLWLNYTDLTKIFSNYNLIKFNKSKNIINKEKALAIEALPDLSIQNTSKDPLKNLKSFIRDFKQNVIFCVETDGRREILLEILKPLQIDIKILKIFADYTETSFSIISGVIEKGFIQYLTKTKKLAIISEADLLTHKIYQKTTASQRVINPDAIIKNLVELKVGQIVVHLEHGVGLYQGLLTIETDGIAGEYLILEYANHAKLYVPIADLNVITRYIGHGDQNIKLNKLGSDLWDKTKQKAMEKIHDVAAELLDVYAQREIKQGFAFKFDNASYQQICESFPFEETPDQLTAINAVINDMCAKKPMDRLVCGDVGFGKTEVAIRAAFIAIENHKQVAILVPTTLLAQQHYENFKDRFADQPINIEVISRFKTLKQQKEIISDVQTGKIDILIGTHKLLQEDIQFQDLGLLVVDEEHRFGVRQKTKIKQLRTNVDILTLTATPIPRTLNMALTGMRDLSIIATAPNKRLSIKTIVKQSDDRLIREAILREISRGGQVYFLHNEVASINRTVDKLKELVPEAKITVGHGQMKERELERVMSEFHKINYNVLVCSTIIETGIDNPNANTIIIERADKFGLAQLHQLRGRVGRSSQQAYVYMLIPNPKLITKDAVKRLEAMAMIDSLGAGFVLANHDLEIRGAGELLGEEQSGQITSIGFSLYMELLEQAVKNLKKGEKTSLINLTKQQIDINLTMPTILPDTYVHDVSVRLSIYKRIASCGIVDQLNDIKIELIDRFGLLPDSTKFLFQVTKLKLICKNKGIISIIANKKYGHIEFNKNPKINTDKLFMIIQNEANTYKLDGPTKIKFNHLDLAEHATRIEFVEQLIQKIID